MIKHYVEPIKRSLESDALIRLGQFSLDEILPLIGKGMPKKFWMDIQTASGNTNSYLVSVSDKLNTYKDNLHCVCCGLKGTHFILQRFKRGKVGSSELVRTS